MNYFISILTGTILAIMISLNGQVSNTLGNFVSSVIIHFVGLIGIILVLIFTKSRFSNLRSVPYYLFTGGLIGILTVLFTNISFSKLAVSLTVSLSLFGQLITSLLVDHFGLFNMPKVEFNKKKITGLSIIVIGLAIMTL